MNRRRFVQTAAAPPLLAAFAPLAMAARAAGKPPSAPAIVPPDKQFIDSLPRLMNLAQLPGLGMGVVHGDRLVFQHYAGLANAREKTPITPSSIFPAASMGKQVFAYAALQLVDEHKLDLDRPLKSYVSDDAPTGAFGEKITARHILSHSSGLPNWRGEVGEQAGSCVRTRYEVPILRRGLLLSPALRGEDYRHRMRGVHARADLQASGNEFLDLSLEGGRWHAPGFWTSRGRPVRQPRICSAVVSDDREEWCAAGAMEQRPHRGRNGKDCFAAAQAIA